MKNGQKKAASSGGSLSAARIVPTCFVATTDYTTSLQSVQDEVTGRFAPKKALGMKLSRFMSFFLFIGVPIALLSVVLSLNLVFYRMVLRSL